MTSHCPEDLASRGGSWEIPTHRRPCKSCVLTLERSGFSIHNSILGTIEGRQGPGTRVVEGGRGTAYLADPGTPTPSPGH